LEFGALEFCDRKAYIEIETFLKTDPVVLAGLLGILYDTKPLDDFTFNIILIKCLLEQCDMVHNTSRNVINL
jgi:hypothetical protein